MAPLPMTHKNRILAIGLEVILWALAVMLILVFARAGWAKFDSASGWARAFAFWGYPVWFRIRSACSNSPRPLFFYGRERPPMGRR